jgi:16S rRNA (cytosine967-C5)-methyltransferase
VAFHHLSERDPALARTLAAGCIRRLRTLDTVLEAFCRPASEERDIQQPVRHILRLGLYQLLFCGGIPARAAVNESVELARQTGYGRATGFVNAVLRAIERDFRIVEGAEVDRKCAVLIGTDRWAVFGKELFPDPQRSPVAYLSRQLSYPEWLVRRWVARYGVEKTWGLCLAGNEEAPVFLRPHPPNADAARLVEILAQEGIEASLSTSGRTVRLPAGVNTASLKVLRQGCCLVQDDSAAAVVPFLAPARGSRVLDLCAAPGGKACQLAEGVGEEGAVIAVDNDARRLRRVFENIERLGLANVAVVEADGRSLPDLGGPFDYALVDAPCSNTAVLRRRLEARWRVTEAGLAELSRLQYELARSAAAALKPGGKMVYSTCTMEPEENQNVLTALVAAGLNMAMEEERQFYPSLGGGDGVYMARLARQTSGGGVKKTRDE